MEKMMVEKAEESRYSTPAAAFTRFLEIVKASPVGMIDAKPAELLALLRPFLVNPERHLEPVQQIVSAYANAYVAEALPFSRQLAWLGSLGRGRGGWEGFAPGLIKRLRDLAVALEARVQAGETHIHCRPLRYLETPAGYAGPQVHRCRLEIQIAVEPIDGDEPYFLDARLTIGETGSALDIGEIWPKGSFVLEAVEDSVSEKSSAKTTHASKLKSEVGGSGNLISAKVSGELAATAQAEKEDAHGVKRAYTEIEQQVLARRSGRNAWWRIQRGRGGVDVGAVDLQAELLIPEGIRQVGVSLKVEIDWRHAGKLPASVNTTLQVPAPPVQSSLLV